MSEPTCGEILRSARLDKGLTREQLAAELHVSVSTLTRAENYNHLPSFKTTAHIARVLDVSLDSLAE